MMYEDYLNPEEAFDNAYNSLAHYGVIGMKWGVRRYQNPDGTLTAEGKRRLSQGKDNRIKFDSEGRIEKGQEDKAKSRIHKEVANDYQNLSNAQNQAANAARIGSEAANRQAKKKQQKAAEKVDASELSDDELRRIINRYNLEQQYKDIVVKKENIGAGERAWADALQNASTILAIGASAASIALAIHQIKS